MKHVLETMKLERFVIIIFSLILTYNLITDNESDLPNENQQINISELVINDFKEIDSLKFINVFNGYIDMDSK